MSTLMLEREGSEFVSYGDVTFEYRDSSHRYWCIKDGEREPVVSVTAALKVLDKPALVAWAERCGIEGTLLALNTDLITADAAAEQAVEVVRLNKLGANAKRDAGADRGTAIHDALKTYCENETIPRLLDFEPTVRGYVQGLCKWLLAARPEPILVEAIVGSSTEQFAGRFDLLATIDEQRTLVDLKTSRRVHPEHHLQCAAYMGALVECGIVAADRGMILAVDEDGGYHTALCCAERSHFLAVLNCHRALAAVRAGVKSMERVGR